MANATCVKICGITSLEDALAACEAGADALGFVFAEEGKRRNRYISPEDAQEIVAQLPPFVTTVAVVVNSDLGDLARYLSIVDCIQYHGDETPGDIPLNHAAVKAFQAGPGFTVSDMRPYHTRAWLLDASVSGERGGTGACADWDIAREAVALQARPVILAGGLTPENVAEAVTQVRPYGVDVSSGVEESPGKKDHERIRLFIEQVRAASLA